MFSALSDRLAGTIKRLTGQARLTEANIQDSLREVRMALLEADVALPAVKQLIEQVKTKALGQQVLQSLRPGEAFVKVVHDELVAIMGSATADINLKTQPPAIILMAGLQGSGKTTSTAKLAHWLKTKQKKSVMVTSTDIYRPAAITQLETLATQIKAAYHPSSPDQQPANIARTAIEAAKKQFIDVLIVDTAGRLHIDQDMMDEIKQLHQLCQPIETLFVVDSMTGQDAANTAKAFHEALALTGVILTKTDGDARGGAALSTNIITGQPIKFMGTGEKIEDFHTFHPDRLASQILGMGDILSLVEEAEQKIDKKKAEKLAKKVRKGQAFDFEDFREQLVQMRKLGGMQSIMGKLPGIKLPPGFKAGLDDKMFTKMEAMINSMTIKERRFPAVIKGSRKRRITQGSGTDVQDLNKMMKQFIQMQKMMKKFKGGGMSKMMSKFKHLMPDGGGSPL